MASLLLRLCLLGLSLVAAGKKKTKAGSRGCDINRTLHVIFQFPDSSTQHVVYNHVARKLEPFSVLWDTLGRSSENLNFTLTSLPESEDRTLLLSDVLCAKQPVEDIFVVQVSQEESEPVSVSPTSLRRSKYHRHGTKKAMSSSP